MMRVQSAVVALALAASGAAWAQGTHPSAPDAGPAIPGTPLASPPLIGGGAAGITPGATPPEGNTALGGGMAPGAVPSQNTSALGAENQPMHSGANSFSMGQAAIRIRKQGFTNITGLHKDERGVWHGKAMHNGRPASVSLDYRGAVVGGQRDATDHEAGRTYQGEAR